MHDFPVIVIGSTLLMQNATSTNLNLQNDPDALISESNKVTSISTNMLQVEMKFCLSVLGYVQMSY